MFINWILPVAVIYIVGLPIVSIVWSIRGRGYPRLIVLDDLCPEHLHQERAEEQLELPRAA